MSEYDPEVEPRHYGVHATHCCTKHGCKYGYGEKCPVVNGTVEQVYPCFDCDMEEMDEGE